ncbi:DUF4831 family protein [uncultured Bacteroides sp.]|jgi:hypothetical protein|uniref:DUF4831 family protein n=1 Tax=uncultured Bacteroides sp. TaxID=162156 RepID=UPI00280B3F02|nr:DUF4831 family protein [uncultured Bacteroides sp.]
MKRKMIWLAGLLITASTYAQTDVTTGIMRGKDYGVTYLLPKTEIEIVVEATKHTYMPGEFCKYADRYLRMNNVSADPEIYWTIDRLQTRVAGVPDKNNIYFVKLKDKTVAPLMELTEDGIVRSINMPRSNRTVPAAKVTAAAQETVDPRKFLTEEILMASSRAKMAELVAKEIYSIRESKNALLRGEADNMPQDGAQLKIMLDNLNLQERAMTEMFSGTLKEESKTFTIRLFPKEMDKEVAFRFSKRLGVVEKDDLAGEPYYITVTDLKTPVIPEDDGKKKVDGVAYNVPGRAHVILTGNSKVLFDGELPVTQFGTTEYLAPVLFNKNSTIKVLFDTATGGLLKVDRENN